MLPEACEVYDAYDSGQKVQKEASYGRKLLTSMLIILIILQWRKILPESMGYGSEDEGGPVITEGIFIISMFGLFKRIFFPQADPIIGAILILIVSQWIGVTTSNLMNNSGLYIIAFNTMIMFSSDC